MGLQGESQIDMCAAPAAVAHTYRTRKALRLALSDHAMIYCDSDIDAPTGRPDTLTPWKFKALPAEAHADLRRRYRTLELMFRVPDVDLTGRTQPSDWIGPAAPRELPMHHPAGEGLNPDVDLLLLVCLLRSSCLSRSSQN